MPKEVRLEITQGPSHEEIRDSVGVRIKDRIRVTFTIANIEPLCESVSTGNQPSRTTNIPFEGVVDGFEWDGGSGERYTLKMFMITFADGSNHIPFRRIFTAHYNTETRTGYMTLRNDL